MAPPESQALRAALRRFITRGEGSFGALALRCFRHQVSANADYRAFACGAAPDRWEDIPAVPVGLFRDLSLTAFPSEQARVVFRTSGTTGRRGVHRLMDTELYDLGARLHAESVVGAIPRVGISLVSHAPDASLGHMCRDLAPGLEPVFSLERGVDVAAALAALRSARVPVFVPGTAFAFAALVAGLDEPCPLPPGSMIMITGGFKGRRVRVGPAELRTRLLEGLPGARLVEEYGMTELSSQLWAPGPGAPFIPPPWLRVRAVDPVTGGSTDEGLLRFYDLANHQTVVAIETMDLGRVLPDGRVILSGRLPGSAARGCSLTAEEALARDTGSGQHIVFHEHKEEDGADERYVVRYHDPGSGDRSGSWCAAKRGPLVPGDLDRVARVLRAVGAVAALDPMPLSQGLSPAGAAEALAAAVGAITPEGLRWELQTRGQRPREVLIVVASGVFTSPLEWVALWAAAGCRVRLKAPSAEPGFCTALASAFQAEGLPVSVQVDRDLGTPEAVLAFGGDDAVAAVAAAASGARTALHGHRFSVALLPGDPSHASAVARDLTLYDTRGCLAPAALFVLGDPGPLVDALAVALEQRGAAVPRGPLHDADAAILRRRLGLARARGRVVQGEEWAITVLPPRYLEPAALPRVASVYPIQDLGEMAGALAPWRDHLSTLATENWGRAHPVLGWFPRLARLGRMQTPPFPRRHDGIPMLGSLLWPPAP